MSMTTPSIAAVRSLGTGYVNWEEDEIQLGSPPSPPLSVSSELLRDHDEQEKDDDENNDNKWSKQAVDGVCSLWELDEEKRDKLVDLGQRLQDLAHLHKHAPKHVIRFLWDARWNVEAAEQRFRKSMQWREQVGADTILTDPNRRPPQAIIDNVLGTVLQGLDREGDPIVFDLIVEADTGAIMERYGGPHVLIEHAIWLRELVENSQWIQDFEVEYGRPPRLFTIISDLNGLSKRHANRKVLSLYGQIMKLDQENYPGCSKRILIIRAPVIFRLIWAVIKHFFEPQVAEKMIFCGHDNYRDVLAEYVGDLKVLPSVIVPEGQGQARAGLPDKFVAVPLTKS